jgi:hypothetical protein
MICMDTAKRCLLALTAAVLLLLSCTPNETKVLLGPSEALGTVLAEETARVAGGKKQVALISPDAKWGAVSTVEEVFRNALKKQGFTLVTAKAANLGDPMRRGQIGLKAADFWEALASATDAGAIVSFAGAPLPGPGDAAQPHPNHPPVLVVATSSLGNVPGLGADPVQLARLLDAKTVDLVIIDGADPAAQPSGKADAMHRLFAQHFRVLRRPN